MTDRQTSTAIRSAARELAAVTAAIRAAYPGTRWHTPVVARAAESEPKVHYRLAEIIRLYRERDSLSIGAIADTLGMSKSALCRAIADARRRGHWPAELRRRKAGANDVDIH